MRDRTGMEARDAADALAADGYRLLFEQIDSMVCTLDLEGRFTSVNRAGENLTGYRAEELVGRLAVELIAPERRDEAVHQFARRLDASADYGPEESVLVTRDGKHIPIEVTSSLLSSEGRPTGVLGLVRDLTSQKSAENALQEIGRSEARLAEAQQTARIGSWEWDVGSNVVTWSDELYRIFGLDPGAGNLSYETYLEKLHPWDQERVDHVVRHAFETGESFDIEHRVLLPGGSVSWVHGRGEVQRRDGETVRMRGTAQDITERKAAEQQLREAEKRYRTLVEQLPLVTYIRPLDMAEANVFASPQVEELLGYSAEEWSTNPNLLASIVHPDDWKLVRTTGEQVRRTGRPSRLEYRYIGRDGRIVWVQDETYVVSDERGEPHSVQGYLLDITERKRAEEERDRLRDELHHAQKLDALGRLAGGVAHDFNNMLTAIKGYSELLIEGLQLGSPARKEAEQIRRAAEQASTLPRQLLAFSRKQVLQPRLIDLDEVVLATSELLERSVGETIAVVRIPGSRSARVVADPSQVEQALLNLALNARDAMPGGGTMTISTDTMSVPQEVAAEHEVTPGDYALIAVTDTGQGMNVETTARVFEPFFTTKPQGQGSGLGLSTVYGMVRQSGGFMQVASEPGRGSCFEIYFPSVDAVIEPGGDSDAFEARPVAPATVVLVEDEDFVRDLAMTALDRAGYRVLAAAGGMEALELCEREDSAVDVLVTDMVMPGMGGRELAERVLSRHPAAAVVLMSGYTDEAPVLDGVAELSSSFLQKPFSPRDLVQAVGDALRGVTSDSNGAQARADIHRRSSHLQAAITCLIADDHPAVLDSVSRYLEAHGIEVVSRVSRGDEALREVEALRPTIALLDVGMEPLSGIEVARRMTEASPESRAVLYTGHRDSTLLERALDAGAHGFVLKEAPLSELVRALEIVADGRTYVDPQLLGALTSSQAVESLSPLTPREREVLALVADGMTNDKAGAALGICAETVQSHVRNAMGKLEADTRTQAVATAIRQSFIS